MDNIYTELEDFRLLLNCGAMEGMVRELEASIKTKEKELAEAFQRFEARESESMVLYQEKQAAQQPDI